MVEVSKTKFINRHSKSKDINLYNKTKGQCSMTCQTGVLFLGHPVDILDRVLQFVIKYDVLYVFRASAS